MKRLFMAMILLLSIFAVSAVATTDPYGFVVEYNNHELGSEVVEVVTGESVSFDVQVLGKTQTDDVKIRAEINGYEYDDIEDRVSSFNVNEGVRYEETLTLNIPNDMEAGDYVLNIEVYDKDFSVEKSYKVSVINQEHEIEIQDIIYDENVDAGDELEVYVRLENTGNNKEEDIKVVVSIPELSVSVCGYVEELVANENDDGDEETSGSITLTLDLPADALTGAYEMEVEVTYDNGYESSANVYTVNVEGAPEEPVVVDADPVVIVVDIAPVDTDVDTAEPVDSITVSTNALKVGFGVLAALLVVLAIVFILRRE